MAQSPAPDYGQPSGALLTAAVGVSFEGVSVAGATVGVSSDAVAVGAPGTGVALLAAVGVALSCGRPLFGQHPGVFVF